MWCEPMEQRHCMQLLFTEIEARTHRNVPAGRHSQFASIIFNFRTDDWVVGAAQTTHTIFSGKLFAQKLVTCQCGTIVRIYASEQRLMKCSVVGLSRAWLGAEHGNYGGN